MTGKIDGLKSQKNGGKISPAMRQNTHGKGEKVIKVIKTIAEEIIGKYLLRRYPQMHDCTGA